MGIASLVGVAFPRRSAGSLGFLVHLRASMIAINLFCALAACHSGDKRPIVRVSVFEDHVSVDGVRSGLPIEQAVRAQNQSRNATVVFVTSQPLSAIRREELRRAIEKIPHSGEIGVRQVQFSCPGSQDSSCR